MVQLHDRMYPRITGTKSSTLLYIEPAIYDIPIYTHRLTTSSFARGLAE